MTDEQALMRQVQEGRLEALAVLFENNKVRLYNFFRRMGNPPDVSEDLVQETFMRVLSYKSSYNGNASFRTWLFGIARNASVDHFRKHKHAMDAQSIDDKELSGDDSPCQTLADEQKHSLFNRALGSLPPELREILVLSRFQQLKYEEIAEMINCNINTLKSRMCLAVGKLKQAYAKLNGEEWL